MNNFCKIISAAAIAFALTGAVSNTWAQVSSLHAFKWNDVNGDGEIDFNNPEEFSGIANWPIYIRGISPGLENERHVILTDQFGQANFPPLPPGQYEVTEQILPFWRQTFPAGGVHILTIDQNGFPDRTDLYFGNVVRDIFQEIDFFLNTLAHIQLNVPDLGQIQVDVTGRTDVRVFFEGTNEGDAVDDNGNGRDEVQIQIVEMGLHGQSPLGPVDVRVRQDVPPHMLSLGGIEEANDNVTGTLDIPPFGDGVATSFFDVWVEVEIPGIGTGVTQEPVKLITTIDHKPPGEGTAFSSINPPLMLFDLLGNPLGIEIVSVVHIPVRGKKEIDFFERTLAEVTVEVPGFGAITIPLFGPTRIEVPFEGPNEGDAIDDDGNTLDEVPIEMVQLDLVGESPLGPVSLNLDPNQRSVGVMEEQVNENSGLLDVEPFGPGQADSFFDVFFEVRIGEDLFRPSGPLRMAAVIKHKPPRDGDKFFSSDTLDLLDLDGNPTGLRILSVVHCPVPPIWIHGYKWHDVDGDSLMSPEEPMLEGWTVYADLDTNGVLDSTDVSTQTDSLGRYWLHLPAGTYTIAEVQQPGWEQIFPAAPGTHTVSLSPGQQVFGIDFGNRPMDSSIHGYKWCDLDGDSLWDAGEPPLEDWLIYLDGNGNGTFDIGETSTRTDSLGRYWFHLPPGNYVVAEEHREHWEQTYPPPPGVHVVNLGLGQVIDSLNFGNQPMNSGIHGYKWSDLDGDGVWDDGERPLEDWVIYLDQNNNNEQDSSEVSTRTDSLGRYWFYLPPGSYKVAEVLMANWKQTYPPDTSYRVILEKGEVLDSLNFGNQPMRSSIHGHKWNDENGNGQIDAGEGFLPDWVIYLDTNNNGQYDENEPADTTDSEGRYWFMGLAAGTYIVAEIEQTNWSQTFPANKTHTIILADSQVVEDVDFGNRLSTGVEDESGLMPQAFELRQNYPNPFNPTTSISYALPQKNRVVLEVFDLLGKRVATLIDAVQPAGYHEVRFDARDLPSGVYVYRIQAGEFSSVKKLILLR